jgi:hypothetical protein
MIVEKLYEFGEYGCMRSYVALFHRVFVLCEPYKDNL